MLMNKLSEMKASGQPNSW